MSRKRRKSLWAVLTTMLLAVVMLAPSALAAEAYTTEVVNYASIDQINIELREYALDASGKRVAFNKDQMVLPNQDVSEIVEVKNIARDAWIRIKADFLTDSGLEGLSDENLHLANDKWILIGDYYYYTDIVKSGSSVDFIDSVHIPQEWDSSYSKQSFSIVFTADAVQSEHFTPDFQSDDPWFGTLIEQSVYDSYEKKEDTDYKALSVEFRGGAEGFLRIGDDFFCNWDRLMPGDKVSDSVQIKNGYIKPVKITFMTGQVDDSELLKLLRLQITNGTNVIYDGDLMATIDNPISLGVYEPGAASRLSYTVIVPESLTNEWSMQGTKTKWIFTAELVDTPTKDEGTKADLSNGSSSRSDLRPQTGDETMIMPFVCALIATSVAFTSGVYTLRRKERTRHEKTSK